MRFPTCTVDMIYCARQLIASWRIRKVTSRKLLPSAIMSIEVQTAVKSSNF